jgi:HNH endonuclease
MREFGSWGKRTLAERLLRYSEPEPNSGCWLWTAATFIPRHNTSNRYGRLVVNGKTWRAHRLSYLAFVGPLSNGRVIDHRCRNESCINPNHLEEVPNAVNVLRGMSFSAVNARRTECACGQPFYTAPDQRRCRQCDRRRKREHMRRVRAKPTVIQDLVKEAGA